MTWERHIDRTLDHHCRPPEQARESNAGSIWRCDECHTRWVSRSVAYHYEWCQCIFQRKRKYRKSLK